MPDVADKQPILSLRGIGKSYGAVVAVRHVDLDIYPGEVVAICGDNGAGKSSLIKVISGAQEPTNGVMLLRGKEVVFRSPHDALAQGVATIYQDLALAPRLSIAQNVFMGAELTRSVVVPFIRVLDKKRMAAEAQGYLSRLSIAITDMSRPVERLSGGQRQAVAISRALRWNAEIIIMDEPTAALGVKETAQVLDLIRKLKAEGRTVILISHNMRDVVALADRVAILSGGRKLIDCPIDGLTADDLTHMIMGAGAKAA
ncbi:ATP-binding cassette domain-containing protein [Terrarubrum flagellatum]|uniref:ATP-binding cassette domain-containing protein n=1 Tax=Terrirubrum flagellatum TaxID=2895980 RepID=UPI0031455AE5